MGVRGVLSGLFGHKTAGCEHIAAAKKRTVTASADGCEDCLKTGDTWVHLRICKICGHVGCCDNSKNRHATRHFHDSGHAVVQSFEKGESWYWCYVDRLLVE